MSSNEEVALIIEELDCSRKRIKEEIKENHLILEKNESNMHDKLVDKDGFPRNDLDLIAIRTARNKIICLSNDLEVLNEKIYKELPLYYGKNDQEDFQKLSPFLVVESVEEDSPAFKSGILLDDKIVKINCLSKENYHSIENINQYFSSLSTSIELVILRGKYTRIPIGICAQSRNGRPYFGFTFSVI